MRVIAMKWATVLTAGFLLLATTYGTVEAKKVIRTMNGIRIYGTSGSKGRVEVSSADASVTGIDGGVAWLPICEKGLSNELAKVMCSLLGYTYGRKYFSPDLAYRTDANDTPVSYINCHARNEYRRHLLQMPIDDVTAATGSNGDQHLPGQALRDSSLGRRGSSHQNRRVLTQLAGIVDIPPGGDYDCEFFRMGACDPTGPLATIECSNKPLRAAPPPPPQPPAPPPAPPPTAESIRLVGGRFWPITNNAVVELNLCPSRKFCNMYGRVELLVDAPGYPGVKVWAPLCAAPEALAPTIAGIACQQAYNWPSLDERGTGMIVTALVPNTIPSSFVIPQGAVKPKGFDPAKFGGWVTVLSTNSRNPKKVQDFRLKVSASQCEEGALLSLHCAVLLPS